MRRLASTLHELPFVSRLVLEVSGEAKKENAGDLIRSHFLAERQGAA